MDSNLATFRNEIWESNLSTFGQDCTINGISIECIVSAYPVESPLEMGGFNITSDTTISISRDDETTTAAVVGSPVVLDGRTYNITGTTNLAGTPYVELKLGIQRA